MRTRTLAVLSVALLSMVVLLSCQSTGKQDKNANLTPEARLEKIKGNLKLVKAELAKEGEYNCCIQPACNWCLLHEGECDCNVAVKKGEEVCPGCGLGWHNGQGAVPGVKATEVKWGLAHEHEEEEHDN
ncbi:MAG: hypothetical protein ACE5HO_10405 [bacterium]